MKKKRHSLKMDALDSFEASMDKFQKEEHKRQGGKDKPPTKPGNPWLESWLSSVAQNFKVVIKDIELVYIYHVRRYFIDIFK